MPWADEDVPVWWVDMEEGKGNKEGEEDELQCTARFYYLRFLKQLPGAEKSQKQGPGCLVSEAAPDIRLSHTAQI